MQYRSRRSSRLPTGLCCLLSILDRMVCLSIADHSMCYCDARPKDIKQDATGVDASSPRRLPLAAGEAVPAARPAPSRRLRAVWRGPSPQIVNCATLACLLIAGCRTGHH